MHRWAAKDGHLADRILAARRLGAWAMFNETTERLMNAIPQTVQIERELDHHQASALSLWRAAQGFFIERHRQQHTISWRPTSDEGDAMDTRPNVAGLPEPM